jgi:hypothetical protein
VADQGQALAVLCHEIEAQDEWDDEQVVLASLSVLRTKPSLSPTGPAWLRGASSSSLLSSLSLEEKLSLQ